MATNTLRGAAFFMALCLPFAAGARSERSGHEAHEHQAKAAGAAQRHVVAYKLPQVALTRNDGAKVRFPEEIDDGKPVFLNFIYTTCTAVCPPMTRIFSEFQERLGVDADKVRMVSISIDPEQDTPLRLTHYAREHGAKPQWRFYTGSEQASVAIQKAFHAYRGDKMNHSPVTFVRLAPDKPWVRIDGFASADVLMRELRAASGR